MADLVVVAAGRRANTEGLNIKAAGVNTERGFITVDDRCCTNVPHIYAIGDVNGKSMLAHAASEQGKIVAENIAKRQKSCLRLPILCPAAFTLIPRLPRLVFRAKGKGCRNQCQGRTV